MHNTPRANTHSRFLLFLLITALLIPANLSAPTAARAGTDCDAETYIMLRYHIFPVPDGGGPKVMGPILEGQGFVHLAAPRVGAVVIFQPAFGLAIDQVFGHVGVITKREDLGTQWRLTVVGADNGGTNPVTRYGCGNVTTRIYKVYPKIWGDDYLSYYMPPPKFNSQFTSGKAGWSALNATWQVVNGHLKSTGLDNMYASAKHGREYSALTYSVRMKLTGCTGCFAYVYVRGIPEPRVADGRWNWGLWLVYNNSHQWTVGQNVGSGTEVQYDTGVDAVNIGTGWNTLKVTAWGNGSGTSYFQFFINDHLEYSMYTGNSVPLKGAVGFGFHRDAAGGTLLIDWAKLITSAPMASADLEAGLDMPDPLAP